MMYKSSYLYHDLNRSCQSLKGDGHPPKKVEGLESHQHTFDKVMNIQKTSNFDPWYILCPIIPSGQREFSPTLRRRPNRAKVAL